MSKEYKEEREGGKASCGTAFVTFASSNLAQQAARTSSRGAAQVCLLRLWAKVCGKARYTAPATPGHCGVVPLVARADEPSDVCWENLRYQTWWGGWYPVAMQCATNLLLLLLLLPVCGVVFGMTRYKLILAGEIIRQPEIYVDGVLVYGEPDPWLVDFVLDRLLSSFSYFGEMQVAPLTPAQKTHAYSYMHAHTHRCTCTCTCTGGLAHGAHFRRRLWHQLPAARAALQAGDVRAERHEHGAADAPLHARDVRAAPPRNACTASSHLHRFLTLPSPPHA